MPTKAVQRSISRETVVLPVVELKVMVLLCNVEVSPSVVLANAGVDVVDAVSKSVVLSPGVGCTIVVGLTVVAVSVVV